MIYSVVGVNRREYIDSIDSIVDQKSRGFAQMALRWWDRHYSWSAGGSVVLTDEKGRHLCYLFYKIDRYKEYLTIHNILTPLPHRRHRYAYELLRWVFEKALDEKVKRFQAVCVPQSLAFYESLGFSYWGVTKTKDYYCNLPIPKEGLDGVGDMVDALSTETLLGTQTQKIYDRVADNDTGLTDAQQDIHDNGLRTLQGHYMHDELLLSIGNDADTEK